MPTITSQRAEEIVAGWRSGADQIDSSDNPAGPLFTGGDYAEQELTMTHPGYTCQGYGPCSACTHSGARQCC